MRMSAAHCRDQTTAQDATASRTHRSPALHLASARCADGRVVIFEPPGDPRTCANDPCYENLGRPTQNTDALNRSTTYAYDGNGNITTVTVTDSDGLTTRTTNTYYDELDRPSRIVGPQYSDAALGLIRPVTQYIYDTLGNRSQVLAGYTSDATGALDVLKLQTTVAWDDYGRKIKETDPLNQCPGLTATTPTTTSPPPSTRCCKPPPSAGATATSSCR